MSGARTMLALALAAGLSAPARGAASAGAQSFDFLLFDAGARAVALGGAYTALAADSNALLYNPGGLGFVDAHEATFMRNEFVQGVTQDYAAYASPGGFGAQFNYASLGEVARTTINQPGGTGSSFGIGDMALDMGYGRELGGGFGLGVGGKYFRETIDDASAAGFAVDAGALYRVPALPGLTLGASLLNAGPDVRFLVARERLPATGRAGAAYAFDLLGQANVVAFDASKTRADSLRYGLGFETLVSGHFALRGGFTTRNDAGIGLTAGAGWRGETLAADYAFVPLGDLGQAHRLSVTLRWGAAPREAPRTRDARGTDVAGDFEEPRAPRAHAVDDEGDLFDPVDRLIEQKKPDEALRRLELVSNGGLSPDLRVVYDERLGEIRRLQGDWDASQRSYLDAVRLVRDQQRKDSVAADVYVGLGLCLAEQDKVELAQRSLRKGLELGATPRVAKLAREELRRLQAAPADGADLRP